MNIAKLYFRSLIVLSLLFLGLAGNMHAQDTPFVIVNNGNYLAHVKSGGDYVLQNASSFDPTTCLWYSGPTYNGSGYTHNYYFEDDAHNLRFLAAPLQAGGSLSLSESLPSQSMLRNTDQIYYFYNWDDDIDLNGVPEGGGVARGHQHTDATTLGECSFSWGGEYGVDECWQVYWVIFDGSTWKLTSDSYYSIYQPAPNSSTLLVPNAGHFRMVTVNEHELAVSNETGGLGNLADFELEWIASPLSSQALTAPLSFPYSYDFVPAYTDYQYTVYSGTPTTSTFYYYNNGVQASAPISDHGSTNNSSSTTYEWTITGDGAEYLSFASDNAQFKTSYQASPTLYYISENHTGHKTATLTLTVTYDNGFTQTRTATVLVKTPCEDPDQAVAPIVSYEGVTVSWVATADSYTVSWRKVGETVWTEANVGNVTSYTITGLEYNADYEYKVTTSCDASTLTAYTFSTSKEPGLLVYGAIFGGGRMADVDGKTNVVIINCDTIGAVFGGNDIAGTVKGADGSTTTLGVDTGDTYTTYGTTNAPVKIGSVYGGGNGYYAYNGTSFEAASYNSTYDIANNASVMAMTPEHTVGDAVWTNNTGATVNLVCPTITRTTITVNNDYIVVDSLFGGAKNAILSKGSAEDVAITIDGGTIFSVYGGNNFGGSLGDHGQENIVINGTKTDPNITTNPTSALNVANTATTGYGRDFGIRNLFGGGNKVQGQHINITVNGGQIDNLFGGGNAADVRSTEVVVDCDLASGSGLTFGNTLSNAISSYSGGDITVKNDYAWDGKGIYNVRNLYGGNNEAAMNSVPTVTLTSGSVGTVYGGGNAGDMLAHVSGTIDGNSVNYSTFVRLNSPTMLVDYIYGGCRMSNVDYSTWVKIEGGHVGSVFGGCNVSGDVGSTRVNPTAATNTMAYQEVQGGTYVEASGGTIYKNLFAGANGFYHCNSNFHYVSGIDYTDENYVGLLIPTHNETHAIVRTGATIKGNVYAGGNLAPVGFRDYAAPYFPSFPVNAVGWAVVHVYGGTIEGNVFGGGNMADIYGSNDAQVSGGTVTALYGGNDRTGQVAEFSNRVLPSEYQFATDGNTSLANVHAYVRVTGSPTIDEVYGGGNGDYDYEHGDIQYCNPSESGPIQSNTFVDININGGEAGGHLGTVYGGGDGVTASGFITVLMNVVEPSTPEDHNNIGTIFGGNNKGDLALVDRVPDIILLHGQVGTVYGGCNEGGMTGDATITSTDGNETFEHVSSLVRLRRRYVANGNTVLPTAKISNAVYGGCRKNGVSNTGMVLVEGGNYSDIPIYGGSDISGISPGTTRVVVRDDAASSVGTAPVVGFVYGGGNGDYDYTSGDYAGLTPPVSTVSRVDMLSGTANNIFGGGYASQSNASVVNVDGGTVLDGVYGANNYKGSVTGAVTVNINGGTLGTSSTPLTSGIFGGGYGELTTTGGNVTVNIAQQGASSGPTIWSDVYGGSALGSVNHQVTSLASADKTTVNVYKGTINGNVYGGGLGRIADPGDPTITEVEAIEYGTTEVNIHGGIFNDAAGNTDQGMVFGGNNINGTPKGNSTVHLYGTDHQYYPTMPDGLTWAQQLEWLTTTNDPTQQYAIKAIYGGGNQADYSTTLEGATTLSYIHNCNNTVKQVYGGGKAASSQAAAVMVDGGRINQVFGGGDGSVDGTQADVVGDAVTRIQGGLISEVYGGSNTRGHIGGQTDLTVDNELTCSVEVIGELYGGGNLAPSDDAELTIDCGTSSSEAVLGYVFGGGKQADVNGNCTVNIYSGKFIENVFGGNNVNGTITGNVELSIYGGTIVNAFGGNNQGGKIDGTITVNVLDAENATCPLVLTNVYGGGNEAAYSPKNLETSPIVNIKHLGTGNSVQGNVYGGGKGVAAAITNANPVVNLGDIDVLQTSHKALISGNVYGGGNAAAVTGNTTVNILNQYSVINGNVFGAGLGSLTDVSGVSAVNVAKVTGNTMVNATAGQVKGNLYGGGQLGSVEGTSGVTVSGTAILGYVDAGVVYGGKVFGAGQGNSANDYIDFATVTNTLVTTVNAEDATFNNNVYGGGENGAVTNNTNVVINSGSLKDVYGAGQGIGLANRGDANIGGCSNVTVNGGTITNVYGGGQNGTVRFAAGGAAANAVVTQVNIEGGTITSNVFGGGDQGTTQGRVVVNMDGGLVRGELFAGAKGTTGKVFVAGMKTLNMRGGTVENHIYGGSRNANDGLNLSQTLATAYNASDYAAFVNISGGAVQGNVYGAGYYGNMFGSSDVNIGKDAIYNANAINIDKEIGGNHIYGNLIIYSHVYAGSNWGVYNPATGFGNATTSGYSNIYLDGNGYATGTNSTPSDVNYMDVEGSLYGSGTSCDAGTLGRKIQIANYGEAQLGNQIMENITHSKSQSISSVLQHASRSFVSIQRCDTLIFDNASVEFSGQGDISQNLNTAEYSLLFIDDIVTVRNGSNIISNKQVDEVRTIRSEYRPGNDLYTNYQNQTVYWVGIGETVPTTPESQNYYYLNSDNTMAGTLPESHINTFRFNDGYAVYVRYTKAYTTIDAGGGVMVGKLVNLNQMPGISDAQRYGELKGFFRMVTNSENEIFAHARPKIIGESGYSDENTADGGFMSYYNQHNCHTDNGVAYSKGEQFPYTNILNNSKNDRPDYRYWQIKTNDNHVVNYDAVLYLYSQPENADEFLTTDYVVELPTLSCNGAYFELMDIDFGDNVRIVDAGIYDNDPSSSQYYLAFQSTGSGYSDYYLEQSSTDPILADAQNKIRENPNTRFGMVMMPDGCLTLEDSNKPYVLSNNAKPLIITNPSVPGKRYVYPSNPQGQTPKLRLRVTYYRELTQSVTLAPVIIRMKSYCPGSPNPTETNEINIIASFTTQTALGQDIDVTAYAMYDNIATMKADEHYKLKVTLPAFIAPENSGGHNTPFYVYKQSYTHNTSLQYNENPTFLTSSEVAPRFGTHSDRNYGITYIPANNADNKNGWAFTTIYNLHELNLTGNAIDPTVLTGSNAVKIGESDGRIPFSIDFTLHYNSEDVTIPNMYESGIVGTATFSICYPITAANLGAPVPADIDAATTPAGWKTFDVHLNIYKKTTSKGFFLDGIKGDDKNEGAYADVALKSIQGVLDHGWTPGDHVLVVRPIQVGSNMVYSNSNGYTIALYRYPGGTVNNHVDIGGAYGGIDPGENTGHNEYATGSGSAYTNSVFFTVNGSAANLNLDNFVMDGMYSGNYPFLQQPNPIDPTAQPQPYNWDTIPHTQHQQAPLINVVRGTASLSNCELRWSQNNDHEVMGGAIHVADGATLKLNSGTVVTNNKVADANNNGGGIYMEDGATVIVKGLVDITGNKDANGNENNIYLPALTTTVTIDQFDGLDPDARIGVYKDIFYTEGPNKDLTPIATSTFESKIKEAYLNNNFLDDTRRSYIFHYHDATTLYFGKTWAHYQVENPDNASDPNAFDINNINTAEKLAWFISYVNGLNGADPHPFANAQLTADIPGNVLSEHYWLPIGDKDYGYFKGTFDGQWYKIDGLTMHREGFSDMGLFSVVAGDGINNGLVKNVLMTSADIQPWNPDESIEQHVGGIAGRVSNGGTVTACQALPTINASEANRATYIGGVVGDIDNGGMVHSVIGMPSLTGYTMGGIAGKIENGGNLYNSYSNIANVTSRGSGFIGALVGDNLGTVENNYSQTQTITLPTNFGWFAGKNNTTGSIHYCYAPEGESAYISLNQGNLGNHGNYETDLLKRKDIGYLYDDNKVTMVSGQSNTYHSDVITYANSHIDKWPGMVSALDHWAKEKNAITDTSDPLYGKHFARWFRPGTANINGDFPVLGLYGHNTMAADNTNPLLLDYGSENTSTDKHTSLDNLLTKYSAVQSSLFVYDNAIDVTLVPSSKDSVFVHEDAVLLQQASATSDFKATVGITFDNSKHGATDYFDNKLEYDWHLMSSSLKNASMGTSYNMSAIGFTLGPNLISMENGYFPNGLRVMNGPVKWDFYCYDEPDYHWINLKRSSHNHWHLDEINGSHPIIHYSGYNDLGDYENETAFVPGKGYMMAISQDSYLSNTGDLNRGQVTIGVSAMAPTDKPGEPTYDKGSNLVGNPYQAYLDMDKFLAYSGNNFITGAYIYEADSDDPKPSHINGAYVPYATGASPNPATPTQYLHPHQAFFIVTNKTNQMETITFNQNMAGETKDEGSFLRTTGRPCYPLVNLYVSDGYGNADLCIIEFNRPELGGVKKIDNLRNADFKLYAHMENEDYGLLFAPEGTPRIPVFFKTPNDSTYTLSWRTHNGTFSAMYLVDNIEGIRYDMLSHDTYEFTSKATDYASRFYIEFEVTGIDENEDPNDTFAYFNGYGWMIEGEGQLELVDMLGRVLYTDYLFGEQTLVHFDEFAAGMYMLRLVDGKKLLKAQKIVIR